MIIAHVLVSVMDWIVSSKNSYAEVLIPSTSESDCV